MRTTKINRKDYPTGTITFAMTEELEPTTPFELKLTPSEAAILMYLHLRESKNMGPATKETIIKDTQLSTRTVDSALAKLKRLQKIKRFTSFGPSGPLEFAK